MTVTRLDISLEQFEIGLSGAVPDRKDWSEPAMDRGILEFVSLFSGLIFKYGGRIVHGSHPTFTPVILRQARLHAANRLRKPLTLVMSELWAKDLTENDIKSMTDIAEFVITKQMGEGGPGNTETRNRSLSAMRKVLVNSQNIMIAVGGKMHSHDGKVPGVGEEMSLAAERGIPRFLIAGLGGFARELAKELTPSVLDNSLTLEQNIALFGSDDVGACVNVIFEHLAESNSLRESAFQPIKWNPGIGAIIDHRDGSIHAESSQYIVSAIAA